LRRLRWTARCWTRSKSNHNLPWRGGAAIRGSRLHHQETRAHRTSPSVYDGGRSDIAMTLHFLDYSILLLYFGFVLGIGWFLRKSVSSSSDFLTSGHSLPLWITSLAFLAANMVALEDDRNVRFSAPHYGMITSSLLLVGRPFRLLVVGVIMIPFNTAPKARSVPEYLKLRFTEKDTRLQRHHLRRDDISVPAFDVCPRQPADWQLRLVVHLLVTASAGIVLATPTRAGCRPRSNNEVLSSSDRRRIRPAGTFSQCKRAVMGGRLVAVETGHYAIMAASRNTRRQPHGR